MQSLTQLSYITPQTLRKGDQGQDVKLLQQLLNNALYPNPQDQKNRLVVDGVFGDNTAENVRIFQGPRNDGVVGPLTWHALGIYAKMLP